ncbi:MAG: ribosome-binding factor A [Patescibacteria group bacterium]|jgi:ribosome-binding factor A
MPRNIEQVNELLLRELAQTISREIPMEEGFISLSYVKCTPDFQSAEIGFSVLPDEKTLFTLKKLRKSGPYLLALTQKRIRLSRMCKLNWVINKNLPYGEAEENP